MTTALQCNDEIFPGYVLTDRLGSGGYAEVWRARAPGGIEKAIKFVYGYYDEELAAQEMKAMERIKDVRHPFLLSLERFEVVDGRLAILTELADLSLDQRVRNCRAEGLTGIPREELLRYLSDAAEALDFLVQKHGLQHLDIKPENLLISGEHIKVADFGLVKELTTRTQNSLVAGMTPTYASPEMFDDAPSRHSDQYSLAIVYQEMLTGTLPYPGRTAAQLAKQHTQAEPQLMALPSHDRAIVAQALAKRPDDRFPSCRDFIESLRAATNMPASSTPTGAANSSQLDAPVASADAVAHHTLPREQFPPSVDDTQHACNSTTHHLGGARPVEFTQPVLRPDAGSIYGDGTPCGKLPSLPANEKTVDVPGPDVDLASEVAPPTLYIGLGGTGIQTLCELKGLLARRISLDCDESRIQMAAFDTDRNELKQACSRKWKQPLFHEDVLHLPLRLPKSYDEERRDSLDWLSRRWLYNIPRSLETRGFRPLGRLALVDHVRKIKAFLDKRITKLIGAPSDQHGAVGSQKIRVVILCGMGGGTGTGTFIDVANAVRRLGNLRQVEVDVDGFLLSNCGGNSNAAPLTVANSYALLTELQHIALRGNLRPRATDDLQQLFESERLPFDNVYCLPSRGKGRYSAYSHGPAVARYLAAEAVPAVGGYLFRCRRTLTEREQTQIGLQLRTFGLASFRDEQHQRLDRLAKVFAARAKEQLLAEMSEIVGMERAESSNAAFGAGESTAAPIDGVRKRLGKLAAKRVGEEFARQISERQMARDERGHAIYHSRQIEQIVSAAIPAIEMLSTNVVHLSNSEGEPELPELNVSNDLVVKACRRIVSQLIDQLDQAPIDGTRGAELIEHVILDQCRAILEEETDKGAANGTEAGPNLEPANVAEVIEHAGSNLLKCGHDRRTILFRSGRNNSRAQADQLQSLRPHAAVVDVDFDDDILLCEGSGISPQSLGSALERMFPGISEAARRLLTRVDIEWQPLG